MTVRFPRDQAMMIMRLVKRVTRVWEWLMFGHSAETSRDERARHRASRSFRKANAELWRALRQSTIAGAAEEERRRRTVAESTP